MTTIELLIMLPIFRHKSATIRMIKKNHTERQIQQSLKKTQTLMLIKKVKSAPATKHNQRKIKFAKVQCSQASIALLLSPYHLRHIKTRALTCFRKKFDISFHILSIFPHNDRFMHWYFTRRINDTYVLTCLILYTNMKVEKCKIGQSKLIPRFTSVKSEEGGDSCKRHPSLDLDTICFHPACR